RPRRQRPGRLASGCRDGACSYDRVMSEDFTAYTLPAEHAELRASVRRLADDKIALHAAHIPEAYGGAGADALATVIVIEEVARACASSSLIPAVNKLGTVPLLLAGSEELKQRYLPPVARGEAMFSYALSEAGARSRRAAMKTPGGRAG